MTKKTNAAARIHLCKFFQLFKVNFVLMSRSLAGSVKYKHARVNAPPQCIEDQRHLREVVASSDGIAFVADGSILPRSSGANDAPMEVARGAVPFVSPASLRREFELPNRGKISGMLVPRGVTLIIGGGYHGEVSKHKAV